MIGRIFLSICWLGFLAAGVSPQPVFLPQILTSDPFLQDSPIWVHALSAASHEVALFRNRFALQEPVRDARLAIFADTRYQVWLDGALVGSGPARFSESLKEYDVYPLGDLLPGEHVLSVLVQWAPNNRRSESIAPYLQAHIEGTVSGRLTWITRTGQGWRGILSNAWRSDSAPVHAWDLIGPTELLDLSLLPRDWYAPGYDDSGWTAVSIQSYSSGSSAAYRPRSIPLLASVPITPTVIDGGLLSPGFQIGDVVDNPEHWTAIKFNAAKPVSLTVERLFPPDPENGVISIDGIPLEWQAVPPRQDIYSANSPIQPGAHQLLLTQIPSQGILFSASSNGIEYEGMPFQQGTHAGRRLLLANLVSDLGKLKMYTAPGLHLEFPAAPAYAVLDLGRTIHGRLSAKVSGPAGTIVDIGWDERLDGPAGRPLPYPGTLHPLWNQTDSWILDGADRNITTIDHRSGRYILLAVWAKDPVSFADIQVFEERYPAVQTGSFSSSDPLLNEIWQTGVSTLYPNITDAYTDTPWRERGQWWGDAFVEDQISSVAFGDTALLKRGLSYMSDALNRTDSPGLAPNANGTHMLDFTMLWVQSASAYLQRSGDYRFTDSIYPSLSRFMDHLESFENPASGLLDLPQRHWSNTAYIDGLGYHSRYGQSTALNALYYGTLIKAAEIADGVGDPGSATAWREKADHLKQAINNWLYNPSEKRYLTNIYQGAAYPPTPHAQAWALAYDLVPPEDAGGVADSLLELLSDDPSSPNLDVLGMYWVLDGLGKAGRISEAVDLIKNYYGTMLDAGATTWWETFTADRSYQNSLSHGWGGSPTWFLTTYLLGASRSGPDAWRVDPAASLLSDMGDISGSLPLSSGSLQLTISRQNCEIASLDILAPQGSQGEVILPAPTNGSVIKLNGAVVWKDGLSTQKELELRTEGAYLRLQGGSHQIVWRHTCYQTFLPNISR